MSDFTLTYHGTIATLDLHSDEALEWVKENVATEGWQWLGKRRVAVDPRCMEQLAQGLLEMGFTVR